MHFCHFAYQSVDELVCFSPLSRPFFLFLQRDYSRFYINYGKVDELLVFVVMVYTILLYLIDIKKCDDCVIVVLLSSSFSLLTLSLSSCRIIEN